MPFYDLYLSPFRCSKLCSRSNYPYYGLKMSQCFCGNKLPDQHYKEERQHCNQICAGDHNAKCGRNINGAAVWSVYSIYKIGTADPCASHANRFIADPEDTTCKKYIHCNNGKSTAPRSCSDGLLFNPDLFHCDHYSCEKTSTVGTRMDSPANVTDSPADFVIETRYPEGVRGTKPKLLMAKEEPVTFSCTSTEPWQTCLWKRPNSDELCGIFSDDPQKSCSGRWGSGSGNEWIVINSSPNMCTLFGVTQDMDAGEWSCELRSKPILDDHNIYEYDQQGCRQELENTYLSQVKKYLGCQ